MGPPKCDVRPRHQSAKWIGFYEGREEMVDGRRLELPTSALRTPPAVGAKLFPVYHIADKSGRSIRGQNPHRHLRVLDSPVSPMGRIAGRTVPFPEFSE